MNKEGCLTKSPKNCPGELGPISNTFILKASGGASEKLSGIILLQIRWLITLNQKI